MDRIRRIYGVDVSDIAAGTWPTFSTESRHKVPKTYLGDICNGRRLHQPKTSDHNSVYRKLILDRQAASCNLRAGVRYELVKGTAAIGICFENGQLRRRRRHLPYQRSGFLCACFPRHHKTIACNTCGWRWPACWSDGCFRHFGCTPPGRIPIPFLHPWKDPGAVASMRLSDGSLVSFLC